jgi:hypothetical protein
MIDNAVKEGSYFTEKNLLFVLEWLKSNEETFQGSSFHSETTEMLETFLPIAKVLDANPEFRTEVFELCKKDQD